MNAQREFNAPNPAELDLLLAEIDLLKADLILHEPEIDSGLQQQLDIAYTHDSNRLEGSSLDLSDTQMVIRNGLMLPGKPMAENLIALNHYQAIKFIREQADELYLLSTTTLQTIHIMLSRAIHPQATGIYRTQPANLINDQAAPPAEQIPQLLIEHLHWLNLEGCFLHPVVFAAEAHLRLLSLHPFQGHNGLCARLCMNLILLHHGLPLINIASDPDTRKAYISAFNQAQTNNYSAWRLFIAEQAKLNYQHLLNQSQQI